MLHFCLRAGNDSRDQRDALSIVERRDAAIQIPKTECDLEYHKEIAKL